MSRIKRFATLEIEKCRIEDFFFITSGADFNLSGFRPACPGHVPFLSYKNRTDFSTTNGVMATFIFITPIIMSHLSYFFMDILLSRIFFFCSTQIRKNFFCYVTNVCAKIVGQAGHLGHKPDKWRQNAKNACPIFGDKLNFVSDK